jgi:hypothetical protein
MDRMNLIQTLVKEGIEGFDVEGFFYDLNRLIIQY